MVLIAFFLSRSLKFILFFNTVVIEGDLEGHVRLGGSCLG